MNDIKSISNFGTPDYADEPRYERKNGQWVDTNDLISREAVISLVHSTLATFLEDGVGEMSDRDEFVLTINKTLCNKIREL